MAQKVSFGGIEQGRRVKGEGLEALVKEDASGEERGESCSIRTNRFRGRLREQVSQEDRITRFGDSQPKPR
jgi:hypothetical protein